MTPPAPLERPYLRSEDDAEADADHDSAEFKSEDEDPRLRTNTYIKVPTPPSTSTWPQPAHSHYVQKWLRWYDVSPSFNMLLPPGIGLNASLAVDGHGAFLSKESTGYDYDVLQLRKRELRPLLQSYYNAGLMDARIAARWQRHPPWERERAHFQERRHQRSAGGGRGYGRTWGGYDEEGRTRHSLQWV